MRQIVLIGKVMRYELAPATPFTNYICFELDKEIDFNNLTGFTDKQVKIIIEEIKNERD